MAIKSRLKSLQDRDAAVTAQMRKMSDTLAAEDRPAFTEDEEGTFVQLQSESAAVQKSLKVENDILAQERRIATIVPDANAVAVQAAFQLSELQPVKPNSGMPDVVRRAYNFKHFRSLTGETREETNMRAYQSGRFLLGVCHPDEDVRARHRLWCRENGVAFLAQNESTNTSGGILVPAALSDMIIVLREIYGVFRRFAKSWPMTSDNLTIPRRISGITAYYVGDGVATNESQMGWDGVTLVAKELAALVRYPYTLSEDAVINIADTLAGEIAYAFAKAEDSAGFVGDGTSTYGGIRGIVNIVGSSSVYTAATGHTGFSTLTLADFEGMVATLPQYAAGKACWFFNRVGYALSAQRLMDAGGGNTNETLAMGGVGNATTQDPFGRPYRTFLGYPVIISQVLNSTAGAQTTVTGLCILGDLEMSSAIGDRKEISIDASKDRYFEFRQIGIQGVQRYDIVNHDCGTSSAVGPVVVLATPGS